MKRIVTFALCLVMALSLSVTALADGNRETVVRVGWYDSPYNTRDASGRLSGYAYEYQIKLAGYTGWTYEYVRGSWPELMEMLRPGDIDLMSDVSYTPEREEQMLFPSLPMARGGILRVHLPPAIRRSGPATAPDSTANASASTRAASRRTSSRNGPGATTSGRRWWI